MRKALSVLALTGGTMTVALAADVPATTPHQLSHPAAAANGSNDADKTGLVGAAWSTRGQPPHAGDDPHVFLFFSNRLGCLSSLLLSAVLTVVLLVVLGVILRPRFNIVSTRLLGGGGCVTNGTGSAHGEPGTAPARVSPAGDAACSAQEVRHVHPSGDPHPAQPRVSGLDWWVVDGRDRLEWRGLRPG